MTNKEKMLAEALQQCSFLPGSFEKRFVRGLPDRQDKPMTKEGRRLLLELFYKYRKQIKDFENIVEFILN